MFILGSLSISVFELMDVNRKWTFVIVWQWFG